MSTILEEAGSIIYGAREKDYGDTLENFSRLAAIWSAILGTTVTPEQVCLCMVALKMSRLVHQPGHRDSIIDMAGYAGCYEKVVVGRSRSAKLTDSLTH